MVKKRKKTSPRASTKNVAPHTLDTARSALNTEHYREAIAAYKALLKKEQTAEARDGLAAAYAGRAAQLSNKGMHKEALVMWQNRQALGDEVPLHVDFIRLQLRLGQIEAAMDIYLQLSASTDDGDLRTLIRDQLAANYLAGNETIATKLPEDDVIRRHGEIARRALVAYCEGDDKTLQESLSAIPFRSPYRDFVQILKALLLLTEEPGKAEQLLARIKDDSAFNNLRQAVQLAMTPERQLPSALNKVGPVNREFVFTLRGWDNRRKNMWAELDKVGAHPAPKALLSFIHRNQSSLGKEWVDSQSLRLFLAEPQLSANVLRQIRGRPLTEDEDALIIAWRDEQDFSPWDLIDSWDIYADALIKQGGTAVGSDRALKVALALRRTDALMSRFANSSSWSGEYKNLPSEIMTLLKKSLAYDPDDSACYLRLIDHYRTSNHLKEARRILKSAQERWPDKKAVLMAAMDVAIASNAFKKAAGIAAAILAVDPINNEVRERLVQAHLDHARKHLRNRRGDLAEKSLVEAEQWLRSERSREAVDLLRGFLGLSKDENLGKQVLRSLAERLGFGLTARLALALEANRIGKSPSVILRQIGLLKKAPKADKEDLQAFLRALREHLDSGNNTLSSTIKGHLKKPLDQAARLELDKRLFEAACETLERAAMHDNRITFARAALKRWPREPLFEFHAIEAKHNHTDQYVSDAEIDRLERALLRVREEGDNRLSHQISELLRELEPPAFPFGRLPFGYPFEDAFDEDEFDEDEFEEEEPFNETDFNDAMGMIAALIQTMGAKGIREIIKDRNHPIGQVLREVRDFIGPLAFESLIDANHG
jgi:tetratricopeptide (TPR) repeat protein